MTNAQQKHQTRQRILDTALLLFSEQGYFNTSMQDIKRVSEVSTGSVYHHFAGKEAIAKAVYDTLLQRLEVAIDDIAASKQSLHDRAYTIIRFLFTLAEEDPVATGFILNARHQEFMPHEPPLCSSSPFNKLVAMVQAGIDAGEIRPMNATVASASLFGGAMRLIHLNLDQALDMPLDELLDDIWDCAWRGVH